MKLRNIFQPGFHPDQPGVRGGTSSEECEFLSLLASHVSEGVIVEIGTYQGKSAIALGQGSLRGSRVDVFTVDPHEPFKGVYGGVFGPRDRQAFYKHVAEAGLGEVVRLISLPSQAAAAGFDRPVGLLWIDGDHSLAGVTRDFEAWSGKLLPGAVMAFDDATDPKAGPFQLIEKLVGGGEWVEWESCGKIRTLKRKR